MRFRGCLTRPRSEGSVRVSSIGQCKVASKDCFWEQCLRTQQKLQRMSRRTSYEMNFIGRLKNYLRVSRERISLSNVTAVWDDNVRVSHETTAEGYNTDCTGKFMRGISGTVSGRIIWVFLFQKLLHMSQQPSELIGSLKSGNESSFSISHKLSVLAERLLASLDWLCSSEHLLKKFPTTWREFLITNEQTVFISVMILVIEICRIQK